MNEKAPVTKLRENRSPAAEHRRQMRWQVWAPLIASIIIVLVVITLTVVGAFGGSSEVARWANISAVWIIAPLLLVGFILLIIIAAIIYGVMQLLKKIPGWMLSWQMLMEQLSLAIRKAADAATMPVMTASGITARAEALWQKIRGKPARKPQAGERIYT